MFGRYLKRAREKKGLSIRRLANIAGVSGAYLSQIETGTREAPSPHILRRLAPVLGVSYEELMIAAGHLDPDIKFAASSNVGRPGFEKLSQKELEQTIMQILREKGILKDK